MERVGARVFLFSSAVASEGSCGGNSLRRCGLGSLRGLGYVASSLRSGVRGSVVDEWRFSPSVLSVAVFSPLGFILMDGCIAAAPVLVLFLHEVCMGGSAAFRTASTYAPAPYVIHDPKRSRVDVRKSGKRDDEKR